MGLDRSLAALTNGAPEGLWYTYSTNRWTAWNAMPPHGPDPIPVLGSVKPQYDYAGADAVVRIEAPLQRLTPGGGGTTVSNTMVWTAAAKPFGHLNQDDRPDAYGLVLPAFHDVRLIPVDASSLPSGGGYDLEWREHIEQHLPDYLDSGRTQPGCWYCRQLDTWEQDAFRQSGRDWLAVNSWQCTVSGPGGGGGPGGGTRRGH